MSMVKKSIQRLKFLYRTLTQRKLDGIDLLEADHIRVEMLFMRWRLGGVGMSKDEVFDTIKRELLTHAQLEETLFYPACEKVSELKRLVMTAQEEHRFYKALIKEMSDLSIQSEKMNSKMQVLMEEVQHHVNQEENVLFPRVRRFMKKAQLDRLNRDLRVAKQGGRKEAKPPKPQKWAA